MPALPASGPDFGSDVALLRALAVEPTEEQLAVVEEIGARELATLNDLDALVPVSVAERLAERVRVSEALTRKAQAQMLRDVDALVVQLLADDRARSGRERSEAMEFATDEVAAALEVSRRTAEIRMDDAMVLVRELPRTVAALEAGLISYQVARALAAQLRSVPVEVRAEISGEVEARVLDRLGRGELDGLGRMTPEQIVLTPVLRPEQAWRVGLGLTAGRVRSLARTAVTELCAEVVEPGPAAAPGDVEAYPASPGVMFLGAPMTEADGVLALANIEALARALQREPGQTRSMRELRLQAFRDLLLSQGHRCHPPDGAARPSPAPFDVRLTVDGQGLASAARYGLLSPQVLDQILTRAASSGGTVRVDQIVAQHCPGNHDRDTPGPYRPSDQLTASVQIRDRTCRFPGCTVPAGRCDLDHTLPWPHGPTCTCNLSALCRHHHRLKTHSRWQLTNHGHGRLTWTTPTGRTIDSHPDP